MRVIQTRRGKMLTILGIGLTLNALFNALTGDQTLRVWSAAVLFVVGPIIWRVLQSGVQADAEQITVRRTFSSNSMALSSYEGSEFDSLGFRGHRLVLVGTNGTRLPTDLIFAEPALEPTLRNPLPN